jgi:TRAP-type mannitol/chloroaromatic compound transport system permease large subunit
MQSACKNGRVGTVMDLYIGVMPFMVVMLVLIALLVAFPTIATWLPTTMRR